MRIFHFFLLMSLICFSTLNASAALIKTKETANNVIQIGMFTEKLNIIDCIEKYKHKYNLVTRLYNNFKIVYAINVKDEQLTSALNDIKKQYGDAFINRKAHFKNKKIQSIKPMIKVAKDKEMIALMSKKPIIEIDMVKAMPKKSISKKKMIPKIAEVQNNIIDIIQIGMFENENYLFDTIRKYGKDNTMMIKPYKNTYISYIINTNTNQTKKDIQIVKDTYYDTFLNKKIHLYTKPQKNVLLEKEVEKIVYVDKIVEKIVVVEKEVEKIVYVDKIVEKIVIKAPPKAKMQEIIDEDRLVASFENLPYAMYGRK